MKKVSRGGSANGLGGAKGPCFVAVLLVCGQEGVMGAVVQVGKKESSLMEPVVQAGWDRS